MGTVMPVVLPHASSSPRCGLWPEWGCRYRGSPDPDKVQATTPSQPEGLCLEPTFGPKSPLFTKDIGVYSAPREVTKSPK